MGTSQHVKDWRARTKARMVAAMGGACVCCGYDTYEGALLFHHRDPSTKDFSLSGVRMNPKKWSRIVEELRKCVLVCWNCHIELHAGLRNIPVGAAGFDESFADYRAEQRAKLFDTCPVCGDRKRKRRKYCSIACSHENKKRVSDEQLRAMAEQGANYSQIGREYGISGNAVKKRLEKLNGV